MNLRSASGKGSRHPASGLMTAATIMIAVVMACLALAGCGPKKEQGESRQSESREIISSGGGKIVIKPDREGGAYLAETAALSQPENASYLRSIAPDGSVWGTDADGETYGISGLSGEWDFSDAYKLLLWEDRIYLERASKEGEIEVRSLQGELLGRIDAKGGNFEDFGAGLYALRRTGEYGANVGICRIDAQKNEIVEELTDLPDDVRGVFKQGSDEENLYFYTSARAYRYSFADKTFYELFAWTDVGVLGGYADMVWRNDQGEICVASYEGDRKSYVKLTWKEEGELPKKNQLKIAMLTLSSDGNIQKFVTKYNKSQDEWKVTIKEYAASMSADFDDAWVRLSADMLGSDPPDLICLANWNHSEDLAGGGYLMDLRPYLDRSEILSEEDFYPEILEASTYGNVLYTIPYSFEMRTLIVPASRWEKGSGWTFEEMIRYCREREEWRPLRSYIFLRAFLLRDTIDYFWDAETRQAHFDSDEFRALLEYVKDCKEKEAGVDPRDRPFNVEQMDYHSLQQYASAKKEYGDVTVVGYPSPDGTPKTVFEGRTELSVVATSKNPEAAWKFMEFYLSKAPFEDDTSPYTLWSNRNVMEKVIEKELSLFGKDHEDILDENGNVIGALYMEHPIDQEGVDVFRDMLAHVKKAPAGKMAVLRIATEEAQAYFENQKSLDQVVDAIQSRVQLFLAE